MPKFTKYAAVPFVAINLNPKFKSSLATSSRFFLSKSFVYKKATPSAGTPFPAANSDLA